MSEAEQPRSDAILLGYLAALTSVSVFFYYYRQGQLLLYGDSVAHINIARRVFDSRTPCLLQLGTVWLPLPHILIMPFVVSDQLWQTGLGASWPSMAAYVAGIVGLFRLVRRGLLSARAAPGEARLAAWVAALLYGSNPNLLYMQATAMTESLYMALFVWAIVFFAEFTYQAKSADDQERIAAGHSLQLCGAALALAILTRYDGWFGAAAIALIVAAVLLKNAHLRKTPGVRKAAIIFFVLVVGVPALWLIYNGMVYGNPLEFANGPYSARAIENRNVASGQLPHPGYHDLKTAAIYFMKAAKLNVAGGKGEVVWLLSAVLGSVVVVTFLRELFPWLLLWLPLPFYTLSVAYGAVPIFIPVWWPFSRYNVRYGLQLMPWFVVSVVVLLYFGRTRIQSPKLRAALPLLAILLVAAGYVGIWRSTPICLQEALANSRTRIPFEQAVAAQLKTLPPDSRLLMYTADHAGALQQAGIPLRRVIQEGNHRTWKRPADPNGLWERALANPGELADYAVAFDDDPVSGSAKRHHLPAAVVVQGLGQPPATIYWTHTEKP